MPAQRYFALLQAAEGLMVESERSVKTDTVSMILKDGMMGEGLSSLEGNDEDGYIIYGNQVPRPVEPIKAILKLVKKIPRENGIMMLVILGTTEEVKVLSSKLPGLSFLNLKDPSWDNHAIDVLKALNEHCNFDSPLSDNDEPNALEWGFHSSNVPKQKH
ncbi:hypothetical protein BGZ95_008106 [Linnemannia exigua]|uniref:Uncharacterized protein n=1 Tax=Linnemannia exigua TaxID=604196 RepID=A0AAD4H6J8_9FUNG|nr:hypothetical protein BGZ95_008106 [Linnemannia exigua]